MAKNHGMAGDGAKSRLVIEFKRRSPTARNTQSSDPRNAGVETHWRNNSWRSGLVLTDRERRCLLGTLLGDASIQMPNRRSKSPRVAWTHSSKQTEWLTYKAKILHRLDPKLRFAENKGYGSESVRGTTACLHALAEIMDFVRPNGGPKTVSTDWLDQLGAEGLAWWYCDDGSYVHRSGWCEFHTQGYGEQQNEIVRAWLASRYGDARKYANTRGLFHVRLTREPTQRFFAEIQRYVPVCMRYKLGEGGQRQLL